MEQYEVETIEYRGHEIKVYQDPDAESPREWDNLGKMVCFHRRYALGDEHDLTPDELIEIINRKGTVALPLFLLDHSGLWMRTHNFSDVDPGQWDSGQVGYIYASRKMILKEYGRKRLSRQLVERIKRVLLSEVEAYNQYLTGEVYGYTITYYGEVVDSCYGFFGDPNDYMIPECKDVIDHKMGEMSKNPS